MDNSHTITQFKNGTAVELAAANPILAKAEMVLESDTNKIKFGDGETRYNLLPYINGGFKYGKYKLSANQTSNLSPSNKILFDTRVGGVLPAPVSNQIALKAHTTYKIDLKIYASFSNEGYVNAQVYNPATSENIGEAFAFVTYDYNVSRYAYMGTAPVIFRPDSDINIAVKIDAALNLSSIQSLYSSLLIEEYGGI